MRYRIEDDFIVDDDNRDLADVIIIPEDEYEEVRAEIARRVNGSEAYEHELERAADRLQAVLPIGAYRGVGLLEVCAAIDELIEIAGDRLVEARAEADRMIGSLADLCEWLESNENAGKRGE